MLHFLDKYELSLNFITSFSTVFIFITRSDSVNDYRSYYRSCYRFESVTLNLHTNYTQHKPTITT